MKNKNGFTLLELLVVVLIIGILAGIALPQYKLAVAKSRFSTVKNIVRAIALAQDEYYLLHNTYTSKFGDLDIDAPCTNSAVNQCILNRYSNMGLNYCNTCIQQTQGSITIGKQTIMYGYSNKYRVQQCVVHNKEGDGTPSPDSVGYRLCKSEAQKAPSWTDSTRAAFSY